MVRIGGLDTVVPNYCLSVDDDQYAAFLSSINPEDWPFNEPSLFKEGLTGQDEVPGWYEDTPSSYGTMLNHAKMIDRLLEGGDPIGVVFEDDALPLVGLAEGWVTVKDGPWDFLFLGGQWLGQRPLDADGPIVDVNSKINRTHAYAVNRRGMEAMEQMFKRRITWSFDYGLMALTQEIKVQACVPFIFGLRPRGNLTPGYNNRNTLPRCFT